MSEDRLESEASLGYQAKREGVERKGKKKSTPVVSHVAIMCLLTSRAEDPVYLCGVLARSRSSSCFVMRKTSDTPKLQDRLQNTDQNASKLPRSGKTREN